MRGVSACQVCLVCWQLSGIRRRACQTEENGTWPSWPRPPPQPPKMTAYERMIKGHKKMGGPFDFIRFIQSMTRRW